MKRTGYIAGKRVRVAGDQITTATKLQKLTTPLLWLPLTGNIPATDLDLDTIMAAAGSEVPAGAIGVILQVELLDTTDRPLLRLRKDATETDIDQCAYVQVQVINTYINWEGIIELTVANTIEYTLTSAPTGTAALKLKLMGWIIAAE